ncbi:MAG: zinc-binding dehydrogenase [Planctomycetes bacterium]|nr:zinc-binding dehydrogenase [Planctomycetota bacterium]
MKAYRVHQHGPPEVLKEETLPDPSPAADEAIIEVKACALNHLDIWVRRGVPGHKFPLPIIPGCDIAGVVKDVGGVVKNAKAGDRVVIAPGFSCGTCDLCSSGDDNLCREYGIMGETRDGGYCQFVRVPSRLLIPIPGDIPFEQIAAVPLVFLTAWHMLVERCRLQPGDDVLVHAAGSGVGSAAVQIAKLHGARVWATASTEAKRAKAKDLGADDAFGYENFVEEVRKRTNKRGVDIVFEHTGSATFEGSLKSLAKGGRVVTCGSTSGAEVKFDLRLVFFKSLAILGSTMGSRGEVHRIVKLVGQGKLKPVVDRVMPMSDVRKAHEMMERREQFGKIVLVP